jgi:hypothetical protein
MKCPKCGTEIKAPWEPSWIDEYFDYLRRHSPSYGQGTGEH